MNQRMLARKPANASTETQHASSGLRINRPGDTFEQEADRVAGTVASGGRIPSWSIGRVGMGSVQRDGPDGSNAQQQAPKPNNYDDAAKKAAEAFMKTDIGKKLEQAAKDDPLVKGAADFVGTLPGKIIVGAAATGTVAALAAEHKPLPMQLPAIPLSVISPKLKDISVKLDYQGPVDRPTGGMLTFSYSPGGDKKKKDDSSARIKAETQALRTSMDMFRPKDDSVKQAAAAESSRFAPYAKPPADAPAQAQPQTPLDKKLDLKPADAAPPVTNDKDKKEDTQVQRKANESETVLQRKCSCGGSAGSDGQCEECQAKQQVQRSASDAGPASAPSSVENVLHSSGTPLDRSTRAFFESRFGMDFSKVRIHTGAEAASSARDVAARAYTVGDRIVFDGGQYAPHTQEGRKLLAHELTHVVQQGGATASVGPLEIGRSHDALEQEAHSVAGTAGQKNHVGHAPNAAFSKRSSRAVQRYEAGEHAKFGETGDELKDLAPKAFKYKVKPGETPKKLAQKFNMTEDELKAANKDKLHKWQITKDPASMTEGFMAGDEITIPPTMNDAVKDALKVKELTLVVNGVTLEYGEGIAMGDLYETPEDMLAAPAAELQKIAELIKKEKAGVAGVTVTDDDWNKATGGRYLKLAEKNASHFSPSNSALAPVSGKSTTDNKSEWEKDHTKALTKSQAGDKNQALALNSFADHFLTDAFASGHLINKQDVMEVFEGKMTRLPGGGGFAPGPDALFDTVARRTFTGAVQAEFSPLRTASCFFVNKSEDPGCTSTFSFHVHINDVDTFAKLLRKIHLTEPEHFDNAIVKGIHDNLNTAGVPVENNKGDKWTMTGDKALNAKSLEVGRKAVAQSQMNVLEVFKQTPALNLPPLFKKVWDFVPHPAAGAGEKQVKDAVTDGTDPGSATLINSAVDLINKKHHLIADELVTRGFLLH